MRLPFLARWALFVGVISAVPGFAQATFPFQLRVTVGNNAATLQNGGAITFNTPIGQTQTARVAATYVGSNQLTIGAAPTVFGSSQFTATPTTAVPALLTSGLAFNFTVQFSPTSAAQSSAQVTLPYTETVAGLATNGTITVSLVGTSPSFTLSYVLQATQNVTPVQSGGTIQFAPTQVNTTAQAALNTTNVGSGAGVVTGISISGAAFKLSGSPLFPAAISAGQNLQVLILYQPTSASTDTGSVQVTFDVGSPVNISLQGSGTSATFSYQLVTTPPTPLSPGGTIKFPDTTDNQTSSMVVRVLNTGNANGIITTLGATGQGYQLSNQPTLPQTVAPNASVTFTVNFTPTSPGTLPGTLIVNSDTFQLTGVGLGTQLVYSYVSGGSTIVIGPTTPSVVFSPVVVSQSSQVTFDVKNTGTLPATISNIGIAQSPSPFSVAGVPNLPVVVAPNTDFQITITFAPTSLGFANGTVQLDSTAIPLVGSGTPPPPLPSYTIGGASGTVSPLSQPGVTLTLASGYPLALAGTLTLAASGNLDADPAVQFSSGGTSVPFVIPANTTSAIFAGQGPQIRFQAGTVASTITLTPTFTTQTGGIVLTPSNPATLQLTVASAAPVLLAAQVGTVTTAGFVLTLTGYSTTRSLSSAVIQFTAAQGFNFPTTQFTVNLSQVSTLWFSSTASKANGGEFSLAIPFSLQGATPPVGQTLLNAISSVSATVSNGTGASNSISTPVSQ